MPDSLAMMKQIQDHLEAIRGVLGPEADVFVEQFDRLVEQVRDHPETVEEGGDRLVKLVEGYPAVVDLLQAGAVASPGGRAEASGSVAAARGGSGGTLALPRLHTATDGGRAGGGESAARAVEAAPAGRVVIERQEGDARMNASSNQVRWTPELVMQAFKEVVAGVMGLVLVGYTLYIASSTFAYAGDTTKMSDAKDVLLLVLGLAGVVIGYYFGRVPADARASQAQQQATDATTRAQNISNKSQELAGRLDVLMRQTAATRGAGNGGETQTAEQLQRLRDELRDLSAAGRAG